MGFDSGAGSAGLAALMAPPGDVGALTALWLCPAEPWETSLWVRPSSWAAQGGDSPWGPPPAAALQELQKPWV